MVKWAGCSTWTRCCWLHELALRWLYYVYIRSCNCLQHNPHSICNCSRAVCLQPLYTVCDIASKILPLPFNYVSVLQRVCVPFWREMPSRERSLRCEDIAEPPPDSSRQESSRQDSSSWVRKCLALGLLCSGEYLFIVLWWQMGTDYLWSSLSVCLAVQTLWQICGKTTGRKLRGLSTPPPQQDHWLPVNINIRIVGTIKCSQGKIK